ncbi:MAG: bifunctional precorrin-2 dehydrogenase/sirohydrochlorin ferrochelatase [Candidatus Binatia bacterium]
MKYYPIFLRVAGRPCLVIGGGKVAERKAESLLKAGAVVTVISPELTPPLAAWAAAHRVTHHSRRYTTGDLRGCFVAYAATNDTALHGLIARDARAAGVLLNVADCPELCDFIAPAVLDHGDLIIATSTSGASPALAKRIRRDLEEMLGPEYGLALELLRRLRERLTQQAWPAAERQRVFAALVDSSLLEHLRRQQTGAVDQLLETTVGAGCSLASLGMSTS